MCCNLRAHVPATHGALPHRADAWPSLLTRSPCRQRELDIAATTPDVVCDQPRIRYRIACYLRISQARVEKRQYWPVRPVCGPSRVPERVDAVGLAHFIIGSLLDFPGSMRAKMGDAVIYEMTERRGRTVEKMMRHVPVPPAATIQQCIRSIHLRFDGR
jgi:hypothetical protein